MALVDRGRVEIVRSIPLICERKIKGSNSKWTEIYHVSELSLWFILSVFSTEMNRNDYPLVSRHVSCNKNGFNITIPQSATVPPLNLDAVFIPFSQSNNCKPQKRSKDAVTFSFPFTDCGTQSLVNVGKFPPIQSLQTGQMVFLWLNTTGLIVSCR